MSACDLERLEALAFGEAVPDAALGAHLAACASCAGELAALRAEHSLFAGRVQSPPPVFEAVLLASRAPRPRWDRRVLPAWVAAGVGAAAAIAIAFAGSVHRPVEGSGGACFLADGDSAASPELVVATEESRFGECLIASPVPRDRCF